MSQAKVDRYKEEKQKREKLQKKEKRELLLWKIVGIIVLVAGLVSRYTRMFRKMRLIHMK